MSLLRKQESRCPRCLMMGCLDSRLRGKDIESAYFLRKCSVVTPVTTRHPSPQEWRRYFFNPVDSDVIARVAKQSHRPLLISEHDEIASALTRKASQ